MCSWTAPADNAIERAVDKALTLAFSNLFDMTRQAEAEREEGAGSFGYRFSAALAQMLGDKRYGKLDEKTVPLPFGDGSDLLRDLCSAMMSAELRVEKGQELDAFTALKGVLEDHLAKRPNSGATPSGKVLIDWNWKRAPAAKRSGRLKLAASAA